MEPGRPLGDPVPAWRSPIVPPAVPLVGRFCRLDPLRDIHAQGLTTAFRDEADGWDYLPYGPLTDESQWRSWVAAAVSDPHTHYFGISAASAPQAPLGVAAYLRVTPAAGTIEIGHLHFSSALRRTPAATEALSLLLAQVFALGYRRCEWKCNALNEASRRAAQRLGFSFEGVFRQADVVKGRNRDTAWFSVLDGEWPDLAAAHRRWLTPGNFDESGQQRMTLQECRSATAPGTDSGESADFASRASQDRGTSLPASAPE